METTETAQTFELEVSHTVKEVRHIALPVYRKDNCHAYKVFSKDHCISICHGLESGLDIGVAHAPLAYSREKIEDCTEAEFMELYNETKRKIEVLVEQSLTK